MGAYQEKLQQANQEEIKMKNASQSKPCINVEPMRVYSVKEYPGENQQVHPANKLIKEFNQAKV